MFHSTATAQTHSTKTGLSIMVLAALLEVGSMAAPQHHTVPQHHPLSATRHHNKTVFAYLEVSLRFLPENIGMPTRPPSLTLTADKCQNTKQNIEALTQTTRTGQGGNFSVVLAMDNFSKLGLCLRVTTGSRTGDKVEGGMLGLVRKTSDKEWNTQDKNTAGKKKY